MVSIKLVGAHWEVNDGSDDTIDCTRVDGHRYSYNAGIVLLGAANMYNLTGTNLSISYIELY